MPRCARTPTPRRPPPSSRNRPPRSPYAAARCAEVWKISTVEITATYCTIVITGMKIWPRTRTDVWITRMRGRSPSCIAWRATEYAPEMTACDAITVAASGMVPVTPTQGLVYMSEDPTLDGEPFGGVNPDPSVAAQHAE